MKTRILKLCILALAMLPLTFFPSQERVYAAGEDKSTEQSTEATTLNEKELGDLNVTMGSDGKLTTSFDEKTDSTSTWNTIFQKYKVIITGISGLATLTFIAIFVILMLKLAKSSDNPTERSKILNGVIWTCIALALTGSATLICALAWNALK
ncbi:MAG: hypothetical protein IKW90_17470 [Lachnospiraceae bacterium]|nr:hypothetical protein [Lachnospiraceae bacterium]